MPECMQNLVRTQGTPDESLLLAFKATVMTAEDTFCDTFVILLVSDVSYESSAQIFGFLKQGQNLKLSAANFSWRFNPLLHRLF